MKKILLSLILSLLACVCVVGLIACDDGQSPPHTHSYVDEIIPPTCTEGGYTTYTCECGESYIADYVDVKHTFTKYVTNNDATDDSDGTKTAICDVDGCNGTETILDEGSFFNGITFTDKGNYYSVTACDSQRTIVSLPSIYNGKPVTSIANNAFFGCSNLISVTIPDSVTSIGNYAFSNCGNLKSVTMGDGVTSIGREAFNCCDSLVSVNLSSSLTSLGSSAFYACNSLESLILPISLKSISAYAFYRCTNLVSIIFENTNGWKAGPLQFEATELEDHLVAAFYLKLDYCDYRWTRSDS